MDIFLPSSTLGKLQWKTYLIKPLLNTQSLLSYHPSDISELPSAFYLLWILGYSSSFMVIFWIRPPLSSVAFPLNKVYLLVFSAITWEISCGLSFAIVFLSLSFCIIISCPSFTISKSLSHIHSILSSFVPLCPSSWLILFTVDFETFVSFAISLSVFKGLLSLALMTFALFLALSFLSVFFFSVIFF